MHRILILDDEINILRALERLLRRQSIRHEGHTYAVRLECFSDPWAALDRLEQDIRFDLLLSDYRMPGMDGVTFLTRARALHPDAVRMILSGYADLNGLIGAINEARIFRFVAKPWKEAELLQLLGCGLYEHDREIEERALADQARVVRGELTPQQHALRELEAQMPGITRVNWGPGGVVMLDEDDLQDGKS